MKIKEGLLVKLRQEQYCPIMQYWGAFEITGIYPKHFYSPLKELLSNKSAQEQFTCELALNEAKHQDSLVIKTKRSKLSIDKPLKKGMIFNTRFNNAELRGMVKDFDDEYVFLDCNHPYIGTTNLILTNHILDVREPTEKEMAELSGLDSAKYVIA